MKKTPVIVLGAAVTLLIAAAIGANPDAFMPGSRWIYRGHGNSDWWLKPSIELFQESLTAPRLSYSIRELEQQFLFDFQSSAYSPARLDVFSGSGRVLCS